MKSEEKAKLAEICMREFGKASRFAGMTVKQFGEFARSYWYAVRKANGQAAALRVELSPREKEMLARLEAKK